MNLIEHADAARLDDECVLEVLDRRIARLEWELKNATTAFEAEKSRADMNWAAYVGADAMLRASQNRERIIQDHRESACAELRYQQERADVLAKRVTTLRELLDAYKGVPTS